MKRFVLLLVVFLAAWCIFAESVWTGNAAVGSDTDFEGVSENYRASSNSFPPGTRLKVSNPRDDSSVEVVVTGRLETPGVFILLEKAAGLAINLPLDHVVPVRVTPVDLNAPAEDSGIEETETAESAGTTEETAAVIPEAKEEEPAGEEAPDEVASAEVDPEKETPAEDPPAEDTEPEEAIMQETPAVDTPVEEAVVTDAVIQDETISEDGAVDDAAEGDVAEILTYEVPESDTVPDEVPADEPVIEEDLIEEEVIEEDTAEELAAAEPAEEEPAAEEPAAAEPAAGEPETEEPLEESEEPEDGRKIFFLTESDPKPPEPVEEPVEEPATEPEEEEADVPAAVVEEPVKATTPATDIPKITAVPGQKFVQIGAYRSLAILEDAAAGIAVVAPGYPLAYVEKRGSGSYRYKLLVGPLSGAEVGIVLETARNTAFPDAFPFNP